MIIIKDVPYVFINTLSGRPRRGNSDDDFRKKIVSKFIGCSLHIDCVPHALQVACHHGDPQTNKPTKRDGRVGPLISPLHNADKASAGHPIG